jgi:hypothetical protein
MEAGEGGFIAEMVASNCRCALAFQTSESILGSNIVLAVPLLLLHVA